MRISRFVKKTIGVSTAAMLAIAPIAVCADEVKSATQSEMCLAGLRVVDKDGNEVEVSADDIVVTPYGDRDTLDEDSKTAIEAAMTAAKNSDYPDEIKEKYKDSIVASVYNVTAKGSIAEALDNGATVTVKLDVQNYSTEDIVGVIGWADACKDVELKDPSSVVSIEKSSIFSLVEDVFAAEAGSVCYDLISKDAPYVLFVKSSGTPGESPSSGDVSPVKFLVGLAAISALIGGAVVVLKKRA